MEKGTNRGRKILVAEANLRILYYAEFTISRFWAETNTILEVTNRNRHIDCISLLPC